MSALFYSSPVLPPAARTPAWEEDRWAEILNCFLSVHRVSSSLFALSSCCNPVCSSDDSFILEHGEIKQERASGTKTCVHTDRCGTVHGMWGRWQGRRRRRTRTSVSLTTWCDINGSCNIRHNKVHLWKPFYLYCTWLWVSHHVLNLHVWVQRYNTWVLHTAFD